MSLSDIDIDAISRALSDHDPDREHYLEMADASVWTFVFSEATDETRDRLEAVRSSLGVTHVLIPSQTPQEAFEEIEDFVEGMKDAKVQAALFVVLEKRGAFRNFREALLQHPEEHRRWRARRRESSRGRLEAFLASVGLEASVAPPSSSS